VQQPADRVDDLVLTSFVTGRQRRSQQEGDEEMSASTISATKQQRGYCRAIFVESLGAFWPPFSINVSRNSRSPRAERTEPVRRREKTPTQENRVVKTHYRYSG
jgi:hypothetical protein